VGSQLGTTASGTETNKKIRYSSYSGTYYIDDVRVRKYASPEPNVLSVSSEQNKPRSGSVGSVQITPTNFQTWDKLSADSLLGWQYKKEINISNIAGNLTNYQVNVLLINGTNFNSSKAKANGDDIRFTAPLSYSGSGNWQYKKEITVSNRQNPTTLTDYQVLVSLDGAGGNSQNFDFSKAKSDGSDIRFYDPDTKSELSYWVESWNSTTLSAKVWVKIPSIAGNSDKRVWMWYGNSLASYNNTAGGTNTFDFFNHLSLTKGGTDSAKITLTNSTRTDITGYARTSNAWAYYTLPASYSDFKINFESNVITDSALYGIVGMADSGNTMAGVSNGLFVGSGINCAYNTLEIDHATAGTLLASCDSSTYTPNTLYYGTFTRAGHTVTLTTYTDAARTILRTSPFTYNDTSIVNFNTLLILSALGASNGGSYNGYVQNVRLSKDTSPEPNITVSSTEFSINSSYVEVPYWLESWNATANSSVWVKAPFLQNGTNTTVYMYYGNTGAAGAASDGANTFVQWHGLETGTLFKDPNSITPNNIVYEGKILINSAGTSNVFGLLDTTNSWSNALEIQPFSGTTIHAGSYNGTWSDISETHPYVGSIIRLVIKRYNAEAHFFVDNDEIESGVSTNLPTSSLGIGTYAGGGDWIHYWSFVRKYTSPEPNATVSATDTSGDFSAGVADVNYKIMRNAGLADWKYRKAILINGSTSNLSDYQIPINLTTAIYNNTGLVGSWHFNDGSGNRTADSSGFGNDGTMYGNMNTTLDANLSSGWVSAGKFGNALVFDGVNDYVNISNSTSLSTSNPVGYSAILWVKQVSATGSGGQTYLSKSWTNGFTFRSTVGASSPELLINEGSGCTITSTSSFSLNTWHQVGFTYSSSGTVIIFLDGLPDKNTTTCGTMSDGGTALSIGDDSHNPGRYFNGTIDEVRIYNRSLSAAEIAEQYQAGKARLDLQDLRFTYLNQTSGAEQNISYWLENDNQAWVKVPNVTASTTANTTLFMYYGNPSATYNNSLGGNNTFIQWHGIATTEYTDPLIIPPSALIYETKFTKTASGNLDFGVANTQIHTGDTIDLNPEDSDLNLYTRNNGVQSVSQSATVFSFGTAYRGKIVYNGSSIRGYINGTEPNTALYSNFPDEYMGLSVDTISGSSTFYQEYSFVRKYASLEPSALSIGSEQNNTLCAGITAAQAKAGYSIAGCAGNVTPISLYAVLETSDPTLTAPILRQWNVTWLTGSITITVQSPSNATYSSNSIWFNISLDQQGSWAGYSLNGAPNVTLTNATGNWNNLNSTMSDRQHYVTFYANTSGGAMSNSTTVYFTVSLPPLITIQSPENRTYDRQWIWSNATLNKAGSWCGVSLDGAANQTLANTTGKWWLNLSIPSAGTASVRFYCNNTLGAMNQSEIVFFTTTGVIGNITLNLALHLGAVFADDSLQNGNNYDCMQDGSGWFGLTSESPVSAQSGNLSSDYNINVSFTSDNKAYLAFGKGACVNFRNHAADAQLKRFLSPLVSFSYAKTNLIQLILQFNGTDITNDAHWGKGTYLLSIANQGYNASSAKQNLAVKVVK
ncbi:MAG: DUF2341 domain-containing protein, partial [Candidatus Aenigmatarchaeota archaeon]